MIEVNDVLAVEIVRLGVAMMSLRYGSIESLAYRGSDRTEVGILEYEEECGSHGVKDISLSRLT